MSSYENALRKVAAEVGRLVKEIEAGDVKQLPKLRKMLDDYGDKLEPWATRVAWRMLKQVDDDERARWSENSKDLSNQLRYDILSTPVGDRMRELLADQVTLITSLPIEAAERVHQMTLRALSGGERYSDIVDAIKRSGDVTRSRAILIARTETARTAAVLSQARAEHAGSTHYVWQTTGDDDVREGHRKMQGRVCRWAKPPLVMEGTRRMHFHPGCVWNCRCYAEPIFG